MIDTSWLCHHIEIDWIKEDKLGWKMETFQLFWGPFLYQREKKWTGNLIWTETSPIRNVQPQINQKSLTASSCTPKMLGTNTLRRTHTQGYVDTPRSSRCPGQRDRRSWRERRWGRNTGGWLSSPSCEAAMCRGMLHHLCWDYSCHRPLLQTLCTHAAGPRGQPGTGPGYSLLSNENRNRIRTVFWRYLMGNFLITLVSSTKLLDVGLNC